jgi:hypothetical protein
MQQAELHEEVALQRGSKEYDRRCLAKLLVQLRVDALYELGQMFRRILQSLPK